jgi:hypothetical protein
MEKNAKEKYSYGYAKATNKPFKEKEEQFNYKLKNGKYYIIRFDGKEMTAGFKEKGRAINQEFLRVMKAVLNEFCKINNLSFAYSFSDEISILIRGNNQGKREKQLEDNQRMEKLLSIYSGQLALLFHKYAQKFDLDLQNKLWVFDARIIELEKAEVFEYFKARQAFAIDKFLTQFKGEKKIDYKLHTSTAIIDAVKVIGILYEDIPSDYKYGLVYSKFGEGGFEFDGNEEKFNRYCFNKN